VYFIWQKNILNTADRHS